MKTYIAIKKDIIRKANLFRFVYVAIIITVFSCGKQNPDITESVQPFEAPQNLDATAEVNSVKLSWSASENAHGYVVQINKEGSSTAVFKSDTILATTLQVLRLDTSTSYTAPLHATHPTRPSPTTPTVSHSFATFQAPVTEEASAFPRDEGFG